MAGPINYLAQMPQIDLGQSIRSGLMTAAAFGELEQQRLAREAAIAEAQRAEAARKAYADDVGAFTQAPTVQGARSLMAKYPQQHQAWGELIKGLSAEQEKAEVRDAAELASLIGNGRVDLARQRIAERRQAAINSGASTAVLDDIDQQLQTDPNRAHAAALMVLESLPSGKDVLDNMLKVRQMPGQIAKTEADASTAKAESIIKAEEAKAAPQTVALAIKKSAAEIGLTKSQTDQAIATTKKLNAETAKVLAESAAGGDPAKNFDAELKLRKEYHDQTKGYQDTVEAYRRVQAASDDGPGDIALIYGYMKMLDPGSVVREGEFATASNSGGIPTAIQNLYNRVLRGERLTPGQRKTFTGQAGKLAEAAGKRESEVRSGLTTVARSYRLNPDNIFGAGVQRDAPAAPAPAPGAAPVTATNPQTGQKLQLVNGQWVPVR